MTVHHVVLLRDDLRSTDHPALLAACDHPEAQVTAIYAITPKQWQLHDTAPIRLNFEWRLLNSLQQELAELNIPLITLAADDYAGFAKTLADWCAQHQVSAVFGHTHVAVNEQHRDHQIEESLRALGMSLQLLDDACLVRPGTLKTQQGEYFSVFTPFKRRWLEYLETHPVQVRGCPAPRPARAVESPPIADFSGEQSVAEATRDYLWPTASGVAFARLIAFVEGDGGRYHTQRDFPSINGTSTLSPYIAAGAVSIRQCYSQAKRCLQTGQQPGLETWISELCWRDFYKHIMFGFPHVCRHQAFKKQTDALPWRRQDDEKFTAWCEGKTGFPIIDAAMRQLNQIGWMHNRLRMITAMFLTKDLFIDWRLGEQYFMSRLIDGDFSANNGGWQWSASTGNDAAPYFRIFNPALQSERFDPEGQFIRQFVPELSHLDKRRIHAPFAKTNDFMLKYPKPIVDHNAARLVTLQHFKALDAMS